MLQKNTWLLDFRADLIQKSIKLYDFLSATYISKFIIKSKLIITTTVFLIMNYKRIISFFVIVQIAAIVSCSPSTNFSKDKNLFEASKVITKYKAIADMNDAYFVIKENNFFEFYRELFDSLKNTSYPGKYTTNGDTLNLQFFNKKGNNLLGNKALINKQKKEIIFFERYTGVKKKLLFN